MNRRRQSTLRRSSCPTHVRQGATVLAEANFALVSQDFSPKEREIRARARSFVDRDLLPVINDHWERATFPFELIPGLRDIGMAGTIIDGYGCAGFTHREYGIAAMELARGDGSINPFTAVQSGLAMGTIHRVGSDEARKSVV